MGDQVKDGTEILIPHDCIEENAKNTVEIQVDKKVDSIGPKQSPIGLSSKRITRHRSEVRKNLMDEQFKELGASSDRIKKSPVQIKKSPVRNEINSVQLRKVKSALNDSKSELRKMNSDGNLKKSLSLQLVKAKTHTTKSDEKMAGFEANKDLEEPTEESPVDIKKSRSNEDCKQLKSITSNVGKEGQLEIITTQPNVEKKSLEMSIIVQEQKPNKLVTKNKKLLPRNERSEPISENFNTTPNKLQSFADLIMWRDVSRSAFIFGIGAFAIISSSYTKDLNISFISVLSYMGLVYLGVSFIFRSFITRGSMDMDKTEQEYVVGEEEVVWLVKLVLPYLNEFLMKLGALFSGDPATTMKLAVVLFILARFGGPITIWKMTKLGFFGVFMLPKLCSSYSSQFAAYGTFSIERIRDGWKSCSHKKAVGLGIFSLVWNLSSVAVRIWTIFLLFVMFKYYQQVSESSLSTVTQVKKQNEIMS